MSKYIKLVFLYAVGNFKLAAQDSLQINQLNEVSVTANIMATDLRKTARSVTLISAKEISAMPVKSLDGILQYALNVDVRSRSVFGVQSDISLRGGNFEQTLVLIDGIKMNDPQTGHHAFNLPIPLELIERIEIMQGGASRVFGPAAFSGVINIVTKKVFSKMNQAKIGYGSNNTWELGTQLGRQFNRSMHLINASTMQSDGFAYNTAFNKQQAYLKSDFELKKGYLNLQSGFLNSAFGAANFYHPKFYDQKEQIKTWYASSTWEQNYSNKNMGTLKVLFRQHFDEYDFNNYEKSNPNLVNFHRSDVINTEYKVRMLTKFGKVSLGAAYRNENINSNRLGTASERPLAVKNKENIFLDKQSRRWYASTYAEHIVEFNSLEISYGTLVNYNSDYGVNFYPGVDVAYFMGKNTFYTSVNRSLRLPTFTELYLNTATVKADANLKPEKAMNYEIGFKGVNGLGWRYNTAIFYRKTADAIDKVKRPELSVPTMENIDDINMYGVEADLKYTFRPNEKENFAFNYLQVNASKTIADRKEEGFQSFYSLNYLRNKIGVGLNLQCLKFMNIDLRYTYKQREGSYQWDNDTPPVNYRPVNLLDTQIGYAYRNWSFQASINNLLNYSYYEFGFVEQPGRWLSALVKFNF